MASWELSPLGFDLLWTSGPLGELPLVLQLTSHGATFAERDRLAAAERPPLELAGALRGGQVHPGLQAALELVARPEVEVDVRAQGVAGGWRGLGVSRGGRGVTVVSRDGRIVVSEVVDHAVVPTLLGALPDVAEGPTAQLSVDAAQLESALSGSPDARSAGSALCGIGVDPAAARVLGEALTSVQTLVRIGTARAVDGRRRRHPHVVVVVDTAAGRYLSTQSTGRDGRTFTTVRPAGSRAVLDAVRAQVRAGELTSTGSVLRL